MKITNRIVKKGFGEQIVEELYKWRNSLESRSEIARILGMIYQDIKVSKRLIIISNLQQPKEVIDFFGVYVVDCTASKLTLESIKLSKILYKLTDPEFISSYKYNDEIFQYSFEHGYIINNLGLIAISNNNFTYVQGKNRILKSIDNHYGNKNGIIRNAREQYVLYNFSDSVLTSNIKQNRASEQEVLEFDRCYNLNTSEIMAACIG